MKYYLNVNLIIKTNQSLELFNYLIIKNLEFESKD